MILLLCIKHCPQKFIYIRIVWLDNFISFLCYTFIREIEISPSVRHMHIYSSCWCPYPVLFRSTFLQPLNSREVHSPAFTSLKWIVEIKRYCLSWNSHLHNP